MTKQSWPATIESIQPIRAYVRNEAEKMGFDNKAVFRLSLAIEEITVNIVKYAFKDLNEKNIEIAIEKEDHQMIIHVMDHGIPFNPLTADKPDVQASAAERTAGGLGLFMVRKSVDKITYKRIGNQNHLTIIQSLKKG